MEAETGLHTGVWVCPGVWIPNRGYGQVFEYESETLIALDLRAGEGKLGL